MSARFDWSVFMSRHDVTYTSRYSVMHKKTCSWRAAPWELTYLDIDVCLKETRNISVSKFILKKWFVFFKWACASKRMTTVYFVHFLL